MSNIIKFQTNSMYGEIAMRETIKRERLQMLRLDYINNMMLRFLDKNNMVIYPLELNSVDESYKMSVKIILGSNQYLIAYKISVDDYNQSSDIGIVLNVKRLILENLEKIFFI